MKFVLISPKNRTVYNFRGELVQELINEGYEVIVTGPNNEDVSRIEDLGAKFELIPLNKNGINVVSDLKYILSLFKLFRREKPDVTLGYTIKPVIYGSIAAKLAGVKNVNSMITGAGYVFTAKSFKAKILKSLTSLLYYIGFKSSNTVIFQNRDDLSEFITRNLVNERKTRLVNGSGVNMNRFTPTTKPDQITFFMLSRVMYSKGVMEYLEAAKKVNCKYSNVKFMLLGAVEDLQDSLSKEELEPYINDGIIDYYGETNDVTKYFNESSVFVLPSYREGTPRTVLEAMAMKRPVITTDAPGCKETVVDGVNGFIVPVRNSDAVADKMEWFISNQEQIDIMGEESYKLCYEKFDVEKVNREMLKHLGIKSEV
ncbi:glycosyltransferase family 4 protein [Alkalibacillus haloalkaliphilus]|uniref:glycosyltransferase family 4 protein n=1 Tax=Alkalibacillus haloalkaliphilus TaxID=94136 RepID=UPI002935B25C|nr:glycosyltransferase family 4 protein [Alkalibacillus haloalkaliphilus]MDV2582160.1 glycosyltransferase family 4 protein [Alkalibacillus haloalkaliphilus]